jgi:hypothetical protein
MTRSHFLEEHTIAESLIDRSECKVCDMTGRQTKSTIKERVEW